MPRLALLDLLTASNGRVHDGMRGGHLGQMTTRLPGNRPEPGVPWALDSSCFSDRWNKRHWRAALERHAHTRGCLFAVVSDFVGDADATHELWDQWAPAVRASGYLPAYAHPSLPPGSTYRRSATWAEMGRDTPEPFWRAIELERSLHRRRDQLGRDHMYLTAFGQPLDQAAPEGHPSLLPVGGDRPDSCDGGHCWT